MFRADDFEPYARMHSDPDVRRHLGGDGTPITRFDAWRSITGHAGHWALRGYGLWAVELKATGELIGRAGIWFPEGWPDVEVAWTLARQHWGRGYATEAGRAGLLHAFDELALDHVISLIQPGNIRSIGVAERLGGRLEQRTMIEGVDVLMYGYTATP